MNWVAFLPGLILLLLSVVCFMVSQYVHYSLRKLNAIEEEVSPWVVYVAGYFFFPMMGILLGMSACQQVAKGQNYGWTYHSTLTAGVIVGLIALIMMGFSLHLLWSENHKRHAEGLTPPYSRW